jgi:flagellar protein FliL
MAKDKKKDAPAGEAAEGATPAKGGKGKKLMMPAIVIVGFLAGGKVMGGGGEKTTKVVIVAPTTTIAGPVVALDPITLNLADGRLLRVGLAFQKAGGDGGGGGKHGAAKDDPTKGYAKALDVVLEVMGHMTYEDLVSPDGRDRAKEKITEKLEHAYHGEIEGVYFHQFVMQ